MSKRYAVKTPVFASGERFPLLVDLATGSPLFDPTVFSLAEFRTANLASATIEQMLRALKVFILFCHLHNVELEERLHQGRLLEMGEIDALAKLCRRPLKDIEAAVNGAPVVPARVVASLESYRARAGAAPTEVDGDSAGGRLRYIRQFITWMADRYLLTLNSQHPNRAGLVVARDIVETALTARIPAGKGRNSANARQGLDEVAQERLWQVIARDSPDNPWTGDHCRIRNELMVRWFMGLGVRRSELMVVKISDVNFRTNEVFIARRADDKDDPRAHQPNTKTKDRFLVMSADLAERTRHYILNFRRKYPSARQHPYLFIANGGRALSKRGLNEIFEVLRERCPDLPEETFPHALRHTWNDNFSKKMDEDQASPEDEQKLRSRLMGWNPTSDTAATYTRRTIERRARKASLEMQEKMLKPIDDNEKQ
jgi:integrase